MLYIDHWSKSEHGEMLNHAGLPSSAFKTGWALLCLVNILFLFYDFKLTSIHIFHTPCSNYMCHVVLNFPFASVHISNQTSFQFLANCFLSKHSYLYLFCVVSQLAIGSFWLWFSSSILIAYFIFNCFIIGFCSINKWFTVAFFSAVLIREGFDVIAIT